MKTLLTLLVDITIGLGLVALGLGVLSSGQPSLQAAVFSSQHAVLSCWWKAMCERALAASSPERCSTGTLNKEHTISPEQDKQFGGLSRRQFSERSVWVWWFRAPRAFSLAVLLTPNGPGIDGLLSRKSGLVACSRSFAPLRHPVLNSMRP